MMDVTINSDYAIAEGQCYNCGKWFENTLPLNGHKHMIECDCGFENTTHELTEDADDCHFPFPYYTG